MSASLLLFFLASLTTLSASFQVSRASRVETFASRHAPRVHAATAPMESKPTLVVGATGKVGRLVVEELLAQGHSVHALVRNQTKAAEVLPAPSSTLPIMGIGTDAASLEPSVAVPALCGDDCSDAPSSSAATTTEGAASCGRLSLFHGDVNDEASLRAAMEGCGAVISVAGTFRLTKPGDLLPWRFFGNDCMAWCADVKHPYFVNFVGTRRLVKLAEELQVPKFVRLTGLTQGLPVWHPVSVLFNFLLSMSSKWHGRGEGALRASSLDYTILRPPGLSDESVETTERGTALQLDASPLNPPPDAVVTSTIPPASKIGRRDVARLAVASLREPKASRRILTCRWVNNNNNDDDSASKGRSAVAGSSTWAGEFAKVQEAAAAAPPPDTNAARALSDRSSGNSSGAATLPRSRPYALAVALVPPLTVAAASLFVLNLPKLAQLVYSVIKTVWENLGGSSLLRRAA